MEEKNIQPKWKTLEYSRSQIIKAGKTIRTKDESDPEYQRALSIVDNWRAAHAFPLHVIYIHLRRMANNNDEIIVAERLKRLDSIIGKLKREQNMNLWTMQDLGGCRLIVPTVDEVYKFSEEYEKSKKRHVLVSEDDYIKHPKESGYRSLHRVYLYHSDKKETYNRNMLIEIQFRTHLQHLWATAVETMGLFTKQAIKSGEGTDDVNRFFALVSSLFAIKEKQPIVPGTPVDVDEIVSEIESINAKNNYLDFLLGINVAINVHEKKLKRGEKSPAYFILKLNYTRQELSILSFKASEIAIANDIYNHIEKSPDNTQFDSVLVRVASMDVLKKAYPNYFSDIGEFVKIVKSYLK